jgi:hypothetical protein
VPQITHIDFPQVVTQLEIVQKLDQILEKMDENILLSVSAILKPAVSLIGSLPITIAFY